MSLLCFAATKVMPGFAFPPAGRLGLTSPPSSVLRSAKTASVRSGRFAPRSLPVPTLVALRFVSLPPEGAGSSELTLTIAARTPGLLLCRIALVFRHQRVGDRRLSRVPGSPPYAHAPFSDPGGNRTPRHNGVRSAAFQCLQPSAFGTPKDAYPYARHRTYFGVQ